MSNKGSVVVVLSISDENTPEWRIKSFFSLGMEKWQNDPQNTVLSNINMRQLNKEIIFLGFCAQQIRTAQLIQ